MELDVLPAKQYFGYTKIFDEWEFSDVSPMVLEQRMTKDQYEIEQIRRACTANHEGHKAVLSTLRRESQSLSLLPPSRMLTDLPGMKAHFS